MSADARLAHSCSSAQHELRKPIKLHPQTSNQQLFLHQLFLRRPSVSHWVTVHWAALCLGKSSHRIDQCNRFPACMRHEDYRLLNVIELLLVSIVPACLQIMALTGGCNRLDPHSEYNGAFQRGKRSSPAHGQVKTAGGTLQAWAEGQRARRGPAQAHYPCGPHTLPASAPRAPPHCAAAGASQKAARSLPQPAYSIDIRHIRDLSRHCDCQRIQHLMAHFIVLSCMGRD